MRFWNHSKQHSSKTCLQWGQYCTLCFGTIRNNTALKLNHGYCGFPNSFGTIRNNTALKLYGRMESHDKGFGTIRNNTALKLSFRLGYHSLSFGTIRNNTALKLSTRTVNLFHRFGTIRNNTALKPRRISFLPDFVIALLISAWLQLQNNSNFIFIIP